MVDLEVGNKEHTVDVADTVENEDATNMTELLTELPRDRTGTSKDTVDVGDDVTTKSDVEVDVVIDI